MRAISRWPGSFRLRASPAVWPRRGSPRPLRREEHTERGPWPPLTDAAPDLPDGLKSLDFVLLCLVAFFGLILLSIPLWG